MSSSMKTDKDVQSTRIFNTSIHLTMTMEQGCPNSHNTTEPAYSVPTETFQIFSSL